MVPRRGLEPPRPYGHQHLKLARLPIPPSGHVIGMHAVYFRYYVVNRDYLATQASDPSGAASGKRERMQAPSHPWAKLKDCSGPQPVAA